MLQIWFEINNQNIEINTKNIIYAFNYNIEKNSDTTFHLSLINDYKYD